MDGTVTREVMRSVLEEAEAEGNKTGGYWTTLGIEPVSPPPLPPLPPPPLVSVSALEERILIEILKS